MQKTFKKVLNKIFDILLYWPATLCMKFNDIFRFKLATILGYKFIQMYSWCIYHIVWDDADRNRLDTMVDDIISDIEE
jgi:hypothetical protein